MKTSNLYLESKSYLIDQTARLFNCSLVRAGEIVDEYINLSNVTNLTFETILDELASTLQTGQSLPNVIKYLDRKNQLRAIFRNYNPASLSQVDEDTLYQECLDAFGTQINTAKQSWMKYIDGMIDGAAILSRFPDVPSFINAINSFPAAHGMSFEVYQQIMPTAARASKGADGWKIYGMGNAIACNFLKEIGFVNYIKPDTHIKDVFDAFEITYADDNDCLRIGRQLAAQNGVTPYAFDRVIWLCCSGHYYRHFTQKLGGGWHSLKPPYLEFLRRLP